MTSAKFTLVRVHLNQGGYTSSGRYFGRGMPLFYYSDVDTGDIADYIRAYDREDAKSRVHAEVLCKHGIDAKFYR